MRYTAAPEKAEYVLVFILVCKKAISRKGRKPTGAFFVPFVSPAVAKREQKKNPCIIPVSMLTRTAVQTRKNKRGNHVEVVAVSSSPSVYGVLLLFVYFCTDRV